MCNSHELTTISVTRENYQILKKMGNTGDSFNDVLTRILKKINGEELEKMRDEGQNEEILKDTLRIAKTVKKHLCEPNCQHNIIEIAAEALTKEK